MAFSIPLCQPRGHCGCSAHVLPRQRIRPRFPIPLGWMAGCSRPMARRYFIPSLGRMGKLGFRRAAVCFLSSCLLDARRSAGIDPALADGSWSLHLVGPTSRSANNVALRSRVASASSSTNGRHSLCRKSISSRNCLLSQRFRRASSQRPLSTPRSGSFARDAGRLESSTLSRAGLRTYLALQRACCRHRQLLSGAPSRRGMCPLSRANAALSRRHSNGRRARLSRFLYFARCLGTALGPNLASAGGKSSSRPEFSLYALQRPRICSFQLEGFGHSPRHHPDHCTRRSFRRPPAQKFSSTLVDASRPSRSVRVLDVPPEPFPLATSAKTSIRAIPVEMASPTRGRLRIFCSRNTANLAQTVARVDCNSSLYWSARNRASEGRLVG